MERERQSKTSIPSWRHKDGGLKVPHLESIINLKSRIMLCQRFADEEPCNWKNILCHYLKQVGGKFILCCNFVIKKKATGKPPEILQGMF